MSAQILTFYKKPRSISEIWQDLMPLSMTSPGDEEKRQKLIDEINSMPQEGE